MVAERSACLWSLMKAVQTLSIPKCTGANLKPVLAAFFAPNVKSGLVHTSFRLWVCDHTVLFFNQVVFKEGVLSV